MKVTTIQLSEELKEEARRLHPNDYKDWEYQTQGVEIAFCAK